MATAYCAEPDPESSSSNAQSPNCSPTKRAASADQLSLVVVSSNKQQQHVKAQALKSLLVEKVRGVKEFGQRFNKLGRHLSTSDQSELAGPRLLSVSSIDPDTELPRLVRTNAFKIKHRNSLTQLPAVSSPPHSSPPSHRSPPLPLLLDSFDSEQSDNSDNISFTTTSSFDLLAGSSQPTVIAICEPADDENYGEDRDHPHEDIVEAINVDLLSSDLPILLINDQPFSTPDAETRSNKEDWNGNILDQVSDLGDFESCSSSLVRSAVEDQVGNELEESPFFRNRSSSESAIMGNNKSSASNKAAKGRLILNPRPGTENQEPNRSPPAIFQSIPNNSSTRHEEQQIVKTFIDKSVTSETLYADVDEPEEDPSSYKDIAHNHTWTCDENLLIVSETSDSINVPDLPLDSNTGTETCSLREITDLENGETPSLSSGLEEQTSDNFEFDADTSPYATELCSRSHELERFIPIKDNLQLLDKKLLAIHKKSACLVTLHQQHLAGAQLEYLSLEVPDLILHHITASKHHIFKIYAEKSKSASTTKVEIKMPDMIHHSGSSSGHNNGSRPSGTNSGQPFTLTRHKKVEIPATSILSHSQNVTRREPSDLGIPYPSASGEKESNVLRKVASLTYDLAMEQKQVSSSKMRSPPERYDLSCIENFEGQTLVSNLLSSIDEDHYLRLLISNNDLRLLMSHFVNYLLNIGIICSLEEGPMCDKFMMDRMYRWGRPEVSSKGTPRSKGEYLSVQEHLAAFQQARQEHEADLKRLQMEFRLKMKELEETIASLNNEIVVLKSRPILEPPPYVPPPSPYSSSAPPPPPPPPMMGLSPPHASAGPPPPPPPPMMMGGPPPPPPPPMMMGGPPPPPPPPMMGGPPPPPPMMGGPPPPPPMMGGPPPPPPMTGGPPPPPPGPGGMVSPPSLPAPPAGGWNFNKIVIRKNPVDPKQPMKPLYWTRILIPPQQTAPPQTPESNSTLWDKLEEIAPDSWDDFADLFSRQVVAAKPVKPKAESKPLKQQTIKILDNKRSQMVGILISSRHLDVQEVESAVYNLDTSVIDLETLQKIFELRATEEELTTMRFTLEQQPDAIMDKPETFLLELANIPSFSERVACFMFQNSFFENLATISNPLNNLKLICEKLMTSLEVSRVLGIILALGNYMNGGNRQRGQADGFAIDILPKIKDVKSKDNTLTLIFYVVKVYIQRFDDKAGTSDARMPLPEPTDLDKAGHLKFEELEASLKQLNKEIEGVEQKANQVIAASEEIHLEPFKGKMESFFVQAKQSLSEEEENLAECKQRFEAVLKYFKFTPKKNCELDPKDFFCLWSTFASDFKDIWNREQQRIFKENLEKAKQIVKEKKLLQATNSGYAKTKAEEGSYKARLLNRKKK